MADSKLFFDAHPRVNVFYVTADGQHFFTEQSAQAQADILKKRKGLPNTVTTVAREASPNPSSEGDQLSSGAEAGAGEDKTVVLPVSTEPIAPAEPVATELTPAQKGTLTRARNAVTQAQGDLTSITATGDADKIAAAQANYDAAVAALKGLPGYVAE